MKLWFALLVYLFAGALWAESVINVGIYADRPKDVLEQRWQPLADVWAQYQVPVVVAALGTLVAIVLLLRLATSNRQLALYNEAIQRQSAELEAAQRVAQTGSWTLDVTNGQLSWSNEINHIFLGCCRAPK